MTEYTSGAHRTPESDPTHIAQQLTMQAEALLTEGGPLVRTGTSSLGQAQKTLHLIVPYAEEQVKAGAGRYATDGRTVIRLQPMALRKTTARDGSHRYELTDIDPDDRSSDTNAWRKKRSYWEPDGTAAEKSLGINAHGPVESERILNEQDKLDLLDTLQQGTVWDSKRQTVLRTAGGDRLISRKGLVGLRRVLAATKQVAGTGWGEKY